MGKWVHRISEVDEEAKTGTCAECGPDVPLKRKESPTGYVRWACRTSEARWCKGYGRGRYIGPGAHLPAEVRRLRLSLIEEQEGKCAICDREMDPPNLDHCHETGAIRGCLCVDCNIAIGRLADSPARAQAAADYLTRLPVGWTNPGPVRGRKKTPSGGW